MIYSYKYYRLNGELIVTYFIKKEHIPKKYHAFMNEMITVKYDFQIQPWHGKIRKLLIRHIIKSMTPTYRTILEYYC